MRSRILSEGNLNLVLNENTRLDPAQFEAIKEKMRELGDLELREFMSLSNPVFSFFAKSILLERGKIKI